MAIVAKSGDLPLVKAIHELADYLGENPVATAFNVGNSFFTTAEKWREQAPVLPREVHDYYRKTSHLMHQLVFANYGIPHELELIERARSLFEQGSKVLDFGAGIGSFLISLGYDYEKTHADFLGPLFDFSRWRYAQRGVSVKMIGLEDDYLVHDPFDGEQFDGVICTEVVEHHTHPEDLVAFLAKLVRPGGKLLATVSFDDPDGLIPQHLNVGRLNNEDFIAQVFPAHGFQPLDDDVYLRF